MLRFLLGGLLLATVAAAQTTPLRLLDDPFQEESFSTVPGYQQGTLLNLFGAWDKARQYQRQQGLDCSDSVTVNAVAQGAFTAPGVAEKAYLYTYCQTGRQLFEQAIAVTRGDRLVQNVLLTNAGGHGLTAVRDVNQNGQHELMLHWFGMGQGSSAQGITLIELSGKAYRTLSNVTTRSDNCGAVTGDPDSPEPLTRSRIVRVEPGKTPRFFVDVYEDDCTPGGDRLISTKEALK